MTAYTEAELRSALNAEADAGAPPIDVWSRLQRRRAAQRRVRTGVALAAAAAAAAAVVLALPGHDQAEVIPPATSNVRTLVPDRPLSAAQLDKAVNTFRQRVDALGVNHAIIETQGDAILIHASGTTRADIAAIAVRGELQFRSVTGAQAGAQGQLGYQLGPIALDNSDVDNAEAVQNSQTGDWLVQLTFDDQGAQKFQTLTADAASKPSLGNCGPPDGCNAIAIVVDGDVVSAPAVMEPGGIKDGQVQISGRLTKEEAQTLVALATSDPLPAGFHLNS